MTAADGNTGAPVARASGVPAWEPPYNLFLEVGEIALLLGDALRRRDVLNAYLFAAAMDQVADDYVHADAFVLGAAGELLLARDGRLRAALGRSAGVLLRAVVALRSRRRSMQATLAWQHDLKDLIGALSHALCETSADRAPAPGELQAAGEALVSTVGCLPADFRGRTARPPSCFHAFDLDLQDVRSLVRAFVQTRPEAERPLLAVGVRTSGSYLAPLCAALLSAHGRRHVQVLTHRPGRQLLGAEQEVVRGVARQGGLALVIDDPPGTGRSVAGVCSTLERLGLPRESIVPLLPVFGGRDSLPPALRPYPAVLLPSQEWSIASRLAAEAVRGALGRVLGAGTGVESVEPLPLPPRRWRRGHQRALFRVELLEHGKRRTISVLAEGVGPGYFGEHVVAVGRRLRPRVPEIFGLEDGVLYRAWLAPGRQACPPGEEPSAELVAAVAAYVSERKRAFPVASDRSLHEFGEAPVWEVVSTILSRVFGRGARAARLLLVDAVARRLLTVASPSVVDGDTSLENWFSPVDGPDSVVKVDFARRSFWNLGLLCYDAVYDLAGVAPGSVDGTTPERLRASYAGLTGETISEARWLLYELAQLWGRGRTAPDARVALAHAMAGSLRRYFACLYLEDLERGGEGPLCLLDLDGVLETTTLGFPGTTGSGAVALRALIAHGYRPVPVSGRSLGEVVAGCRSYGLAGGVAEYGAAVYTASLEQTRVLLDASELHALARVREALARTEGVGLDDSYHLSVRAFTTDGQGRRAPLDRVRAEAARAAGGGQERIALVTGEGQTDFVPVRVDKGRGARALVEQLAAADGGRRPEIALAVGDTLADLPMLEEARLSFAPAHARTALRGTGVEVVGAPYQAGLSMAVERLLGHAPGSCPACRAPVLDEESALLTALLSAGEAGRLALARRSLQLGLRVRSAASRRSTGHTGSRRR